VELQAAVLTSGSLMTIGSDLGLTGLDLSSGIFLLLKIDLWCRSMIADTKHRPFFIPHKSYHLRWLAPKIGYQPALQTFFCSYGIRFDTK
jgi:hypothetical protein